MSWLILALLAAFFLATADAITKWYLADFSPGLMALIRFGVTAVLLLPLLLFIPWPHPPLAFWGWVAALLPLEVLAMWFYMQAIRTSPLSLTLPYLAFTPVFNVLTGYVLLGETVNKTGMAGILLVVAGAWLLNLDLVYRNGYRNLLTPFLAIGRERGARLMLATAAKRTSLLFGMAYGAWLFKEPGLGRNLTAGALMVAGVVLIAA